MDIVEVLGMELGMMALTLACALHTARRVYTRYRRAKGWDTH